MTAAWFKTAQRGRTFVKPLQTWLANLSKKQPIILQLSIYMVAPSPEHYLQLENNWSQRAYLLPTVRCDPPLSRLRWPKPVCHSAKKPMHCVCGQLRCIQSTCGSGWSWFLCLIWSRMLAKIRRLQDFSPFVLCLIDTIQYFCFSIFNGPFGKAVPRFGEQNQALEASLFERYYSSNYSHLKRNLFLYLQRRPSEALHAIETTSAALWTWSWKLSEL